MSDTPRAAETAAPPGFGLSALAVAGLVVVSRLPFLGPGYGGDSDAWRVAWAARVIATTGGYEAARFPGNPVHEFACALLWRGGPLALCSASAVMSAVAAAAFVSLFRRLGGRDAVLAGLALASTPALYVVSVQAMDYAWALAFALLALDQAARGRATVSGCLAGLAIGCRITSGVWLVPLAAALVQARPPGRRLGAVAVQSALALLVGALAFLPALYVYGPGFLRFYADAYPSPAIVLKNATLDLWGVPGTLALLLALPLAWRGGRGGPRAAALTSRPAGVLAAAGAVAIALFLVAFLRVPWKAAYLIPAVPLVLILFATRLARPAFAAVCIALVASPWVLKLSLPDPEGADAPSAAAVTVRVAGRPLVVDLGRGPLLTAQQRRRHDLERLDRILARAAGLRDESVVVTAGWMPQIRLRLGGKVQGRVRYEVQLTAPELRALRARGVALYDLPGAEWANLRTCGASLRANGSRPLDLE